MIFIELEEVEELRKAVGIDKAVEMAHRYDFSKMMTEQEFKDLKKFYDDESKKTDKLMLENFTKGVRMVLNQKILQAKQYATLKKLLEINESTTIREAMKVLNFIVLGTDYQEYQDFLQLLDKETPNEIK